MKLETILPRTVNFHNQTLITLKKDNIVYVAMKPICENIGLDWDSQRKRIERDEVLNSTTVIMTVVAQDNKKREMLCLPIHYLNGWLFGVDVSRVKAEIKDKIIMYKKECYQVLHDYWNNGIAINPRLSSDDTLPLRNAVNLATGVLKLDYSTIYKMVHQRFGVDEIKELSREQIGQAVEYVHHLMLQSGHQSEQPFNIKDYLNQKSNQVMDYVHSLEHIVFNATGKYPQRPFKPDEIAKGIIGHCLNTQTIELNFSERGLGFNLVDRTTLRIHDSNIAEHIKNGNVSKKYLDEIIQASVARLA